MCAYHRHVHMPTNVAVIMPCTGNRFHYTVILMFIIFKEDEKKLYEWKVEVSCHWKGSMILSTSEKSKSMKKKIYCSNYIYMFKLLHISGSCKDEDRQKGSPCNYWEILHKVNTWFSYKQEGMWRDSHLTQ